MKAAETALQEVNKELAKLEDEETALQKDVVDVKNELEKFQNIVKENQQKIKHWKKEVSCWNGGSFLLQFRRKNMCLPNI